ncbi:MAG: ChrR family anti-sigma-E factor [Alphaproteobacteria bacterium]
MNMTNYRPSHHPADDALLDYAAGAASEAASVMIASHLALCPACRAEVARLEALGGAMLEDLPPTPMAAADLDGLLARLDALDAEPAVAAPRAAVPAPSILIPRPLRDYLADMDVGGDLAALPWRKLGGGVDEIAIPQATSAGERLRLLRIKAGSAVPRHTHHGNEMVMVLTGGFTDASGHYQRGDVGVSDRDIDHTPVADRDTDCVCLSFTDAPLLFTGPIGWILNRIVKF